MIFIHKFGWFHVRLVSKLTESRLRQHVLPVQTLKLRSHSHAMLKRNSICRGYFYVTPICDEVKKWYRTRNSKNKKQEYLDIPLPFFSLSCFISRFLVVASVFFSFRFGLHSKKDNIFALAIKRQRRWEARHNRRLCVCTSAMERGEGTKRFKGVRGAGLGLTLCWGVVWCILSSVWW